MHDSLIQELVGPYSKILLDIMLVLEELQSLGFDSDLAPEKLSRADREKLQHANKQVLEALIRTIKNPTYQKLLQDDRLAAVSKIFNRHRLPVLTRLQKAIIK